MLGEMWRAAGLAKLSALKDYMRDLLGGDEGGADGGGTDHRSLRACSLHVPYVPAFGIRQSRGVLGCYMLACWTKRVWLSHACLSARLACVSGHRWIGRALSLLTRLTFASVPRCAGKMLVFAHHLAVLDEAQKVAVNARVGFVRIDGSTSQADRHAAVQRFQGDPQVRLAILSIKAAGQGASSVIPRASLLFPKFFSLARCPILHAQLHFPPPKRA